MAVVEAPPYAFLVGGNVHSPTAQLPLPDFQIPAGDVAVMNLTDGAFGDTIQLREKRSYPMAAVSISGTVSHVIIAGGFTLDNDSAIEIIKFDTAGK